MVGAAIGNLLPNRKDFQQSAAPIARGTLIEPILGLLPGNGAVLGSFASYTIEKKLAEDPTRFGRGAIEASPDRNRRTTPVPRPPLFHCSRSVFHRMR